MIVDPSYLSHPKFLMLKNRFGPEALYLIIRLWAHCQNSRSFTFTGGKEYLSAICQFEDAEKLWSAFVELKIIDVFDDYFEVHGWAEVNSQLVTNWKNGRYGKLGGRPVSEGKNPKGSHRVANGLPMATPMAPPTRSDQIREDEIRIPETLDYLSFKSAWNEWMEYRGKLGGVKDWPAFWNKQLKAMEQVGATAAVNAMNESMMQGWRGLFFNRSRPQATHPPRREITLAEQLAAQK